MSGYIYILTAHYAAPEIRGKELELASAFSKSIKNEVSEKETILALKALAVTMVTTADDNIFDAVSTLLKRTISDSADLHIKAAAIHTLGACIFFGGATEDELLEQMAYLLEIISSDGHFVEAGDSAEVVIAALEEYALLATEVEDMSDDSETAMESLLDQLDSSDPDVQIAAGELIALLYEKSYGPPELRGDKGPNPHSGPQAFSRGRGRSREAAQGGNEVIAEEEEEELEDGSEKEEEDSEVEEEEEEEKVTEDEADSSSSEIDDRPINKLVKLYEPYHNKHQVLDALKDLSKVSGHRVSKTKRKDLHGSFANILQSIKTPWHGPYYSTALNDRHEESGNQMKVKVGKNMRFTLDKWWKVVRYQAMQRVLQGGFLRHFDVNEAVQERFPVRVESFERDRSPGRKKREGFQEW